MRLENQTGESMTIFLRDSVVAPAVPTPGAALLAGRAPSPIHERVGAYEIRLATTARELRQAQRLRYAVFYEDGGAMASAAAASVRRDLCPFDAICDHLIVVDTEAVSRVGARKPRVVGTYRLLRREVAERHGGFYSQGEFDLAPLMAAHPRARLLELGRSCVQANYRAKRVIELLWRGLWLYASHFGVDALIGCASLSGTDLAALDLPLSFLLRCAQADDDWQVAALPHRAAKFTARPENEIDQRRALAVLPPLVKAYMRTGARFGRNAVIDHQFGTTDVFAIMPMSDIEARYLSYYGAASCVSGVSVA